MRTLPTHQDVYSAVAESEPVTAEDVRRAVGARWEQRGTVYNRLEDLVSDGELISDEERPRRYAVNHLC